jgi:hypothetical protein
MVADNPKSCAMAFDYTPSLTAHSKPGLSPGIKNVPFLVKL